MNSESFSSLSPKSPYQDNSLPQEESKGEYTMNLNKIDNDQNSQKKSRFDGGFSNVINKSPITKKSGLSLKINHSKNDSFSGSMKKSEFSPIKINELSNNDKFFDKKNSLNERTYPSKSFYSPQKKNEKSSPMFPLKTKNSLQEKSKTKEIKLSPQKINKL